MTIKLVVFKVLTFSILIVILILLSLMYLTGYDIKIAVLNVNKIGHLAINTEIALREFYRSKNSKKKLILFAPLSSHADVSNEQLIKMYSRHKNIHISRFAYALISVWQKYLIKTPFFFKTTVRGDEFELFDSVDTTISFSSSEIYKGKSLLSQLKINNKYVCIFMRDSNYWEVNEGRNQSFRSCRDGDIDTMISTVQYLIKNGYYVVRVGSLASKKMSFEHRMFIDYSFTEYVSDFNDIYLIANCNFMISSQSGIADIATIFDVPKISINCVPFLQASLGKKCMFIPKRIICDRGNTPFFDDRLKNVILNMECSKAYSLGCEYIDNTEDEILSAVVDFTRYIDNGYVIDTDYACEMKRYHKKYLKGTRLDGLKTPLCPSWFEANRKLYGL